MTHVTTVSHKPRRPLSNALVAKESATAMTRAPTIFVTFLLMLSVSGCASIGPRTIVRDRFDYITAISESWKSQTLLNLVKIRYGDAPVFLNVASVINQYAVESSVTLSGTWFVNPFEEHNAAQNLSAMGGYSDKPTITYTPLSGEKFARKRDCFVACGSSQ